MKEELFLLLSFFILTLDHRKPVIQNLLVKNSKGLLEMFEEQERESENDDDKQLMTHLSNELLAFAQK